MTTPSGATVRQSVALVWRTLRSMRTALILLLILAAASVIGSLLPQIPNSPERVGRYLADHGAWGTFLFRAGFFDVYGSWWFVLITTLLFVSLAACLFPRTRALLRAIRQRPVHARELDGFRHHAELRVRAGPGEAAAGAARYLRRKRFRVSRQGDGVAAEKGVLREVGSLLFHWAFFLLLVGVIVGQGDGVHRSRRRHRGRDVGRRARELRRRDPHRPLLRRQLHGARPRAPRLRRQLPAERHADRLRLAGPVPRPRGPADRDARRSG